MRFFKSSTLCGIAALAALAALPQTAQASLITYTLAGQGSGTVNGVAFTAQAFTITGIGDTTNLTTIFFNAPAVPLSSLTFTINGFAAATATPQMYMANFNAFVPNNLGFTNLTGNQFEQFSAGSGSWGVISSIGPVSATFSDSLQTPTNLGNVRITSFTGPTTFTATLGASSVPEPGTLAMLALGLSVGIVARRRK